MHRDYIPESDDGALAWMRNFSQMLLVRPEVFHVRPDVADEVAERVRAFAEALRHTQDTTTAGRYATSLKTEARRAAMQICRRAAQQIKADPTVRDPDKISAGIRPTNAARSRVRLGGSVPLLRISLTPGGGHRLSFVDRDDPHRRAKPAGAAALQLFRRRVDAEERGGGSESKVSLELVGTYTRWPIVLDGGFGGGGRSSRRVTYAARWVSRRGEQSGWSMPVSMLMAA